MSAFHFSPRPNRADEIGWREWGLDAFTAARSEDKPILLGISAVWCHWCHVMDETTYSDPGVIDLINRDYIPIRVDNDLRPDVNNRYNMGGWPTTAFLTPQGDILTGATYLPPDQMRGALERVAGYYRTRKPEIVAQVLESRKKASTMLASSAGSLDPRLVDAVLAAVENAYDRTYGGFGGSPKFPQTDAIALLVEQSARRDEAQLLEMARFTLRQMAGGGTYDHVEGGFFRYSTTQDWSVPHFEKMLEDHGGLISALALAGEGEILDSATGYLDRLLRDPETGLYAGSQDADEHYYALDATGRAELEPPYIDRRVYSSWNSMLAVGYLEADARLGRPALREEARELLDRLFRDSFTPAGGMLHAEGVGGQLGDQVWALLAAVRAFQAGLGPSWLEAAEQLAAHLEVAYADRDFGGYFDSAAGEALGRLEHPLKPIAENSVAALALFELGTLAGGDHVEHGRRALESVAMLPARYGLMAAGWARAYDRYLGEPVKVTTGSAELARAALALKPYAVIEPITDQRAIVCLGTLCLAPVSELEGLRQALTEQPAVQTIELPDR
ncbi:MAG: DUF255 domain-containing protein [Candidatus Dormibacteraeota bacterium]|nr:DUF255 domain-containing protein [Candidatus Dormibacteraeota bacterium]